MDKSWMHANRRSKAYELGVEGFLNFAVENLGNTTHIHCPCNIGSDPYEFANVIRDGDQPLYPGCRKYMKLSALVKLYNLKVKHGMSDVCFTELLILQGDFLTEGSTMPSSMYEAKKTLSTLGMS
ncbi:hypothetical protein L3X38_032907 [Prunus dulcis]|uniref:Transposase-associated domain-containing protein n=1 Tax=Prunus dulcis TaxID=3755 RepID=A0AAD4VEX4_PRUDU|nr:hypothetical protein L3X38_032907 [Prunus dulcis]